MSVEEINPLNKSFHALIEFQPINNQISAVSFYKSKSQIKDVQF